MISIPKIQRTSPKSYHFVVNIDGDYNDCVVLDLVEDRMVCIAACEAERLEDEHVLASKLDMTSHENQEGAADHTWLQGQEGLESSRTL